MPLNTSQKKQLEAAKRDLAQIENNIRIYTARLPNSNDPDALQKAIDLEKEQKVKVQNTIRALEAEARKPVPKPWSKK